MLNNWVIIVASLAYIGVLFAIATYGDRLAAKRPVGQRVHAKPLIYALTLAVYCTSWTFYGSVGLAASSGYDFLPVYLGPILLFTLGYPVLRKIIRIAKAENITTIADFISARFGKSQTVAAVVTIIVVIGILPYIALQLKAVSASFTVLTNDPAVVLLDAASIAPWWSDTALVVAALMAVFSIIFGTRNIDATEHHHGMMLAIAFESVVKLVAFLAAGLFVTFIMFGGIGDLLSNASASPLIVERFTGAVDGTKWVTIALLSMAAIICLPRQFHVAVVENADESELKKAAWLFPAYLVAINLFVIPIALAGLLAFGGSGVDADTFVLALPMLAQQETLALFVFIGGLSAATGMVIVATVALSTMISNDVVMPLVLRYGARGAARRHDYGQLLLNVRRVAMFAILMLAFAYYRVAGEGQALASIGLISFAAVAQFAPSIFGAIFWERASRVGALGGVIVGFALWAYTLLLPTFSESTWLPVALLTDGPWSIAALAPHSLFGFALGDPLTHGVVWSVGANVLMFIVLSLFARPKAIERSQAQAFVQVDAGYAGGRVRALKGTLTVGDLQEIAAGYLGSAAVTQAFHSYAATHDDDMAATSAVDMELLRYTERLLASAIGASSARLVIALSLERSDLDMQSAMALLDDASAAIRYNRELLQSTMENVRQGIAVYDENLRLVWWNHRFSDYLNLPEAFARIGVSAEEIIRYSAEHGEYGPGDVESIVAELMAQYRSRTPITYERRLADGTILEVGTSATPGGNVVATLNDVTERVQAAAELAEAKQSLELRVAERTRALTQLNDQLREATLAAEDANLGKTRFLAAASHDLLQPLNAARLFLSSLAERPQPTENGGLIERIDTSLKSVEDLLEELLDISKLDAGGVVPQLEDFALNELLAELATQFAALAEEGGVALQFVPTHRIVHSDRRLLRRILQNFLSNAIRYTPAGGRVLLGCRTAGDGLRLEVWDTGPGIPDDMHDAVFREFQRIAGPAGATQGLGLGLAIVDRIARMLDHEITVRSQVGKGSVFAVTVPVGNALPAGPELAELPDPRLRELDGAVVLCIDDSPDILDGMTALLSGWHCDVRVAASGAQWRDALRGDTPDIILADYHLDDDLNGLQLIAEICGETGSLIPAVVISADRTEALREEAVRRGHAILAKPVKPAALRVLMTRLLVQR
ncbi:MAG: hybrid sensor histidine kinase/response regulator, partial [Alphaproteobacteria bacterium]|nr:hybrid sensor histidine kinase/response regulator [Alphaproteobacteria bacterium]